MKENTIIIAADHAGFNLKNQVIDHLKNKNFTIQDLGCFNEESVDYPDYAQKLCSLIDKNYGILICGTGIGMSICANRFPHIRAALCFNSIMAQASREHNNANILVLGARIIDSKTSLECVDAFLSNNHPIQPRHQQRLEKINLNFIEAKI